MENEKWRFFQNGSLKNFILSSMCLFLGQTKRPLGSGCYCLMYMATLVVARRGLYSQRPSPKPILKIECLVVGPHQYSMK